MPNFPNTAAKLTTYDPNGLLDRLSETLNAKNDAALARLLKVAPPVISKIRHRRLPISASILICMHEVSNITIKELRQWMGDTREKFARFDFDSPCSV